MIRGLIFDMDGTLGNTLPVCFAGFRRALEAFGVVMSDAEVVARFGPTEEGIIRGLVRPEQGDEAARIYRETYEQVHAEICPEPFEGIREAIESLRRSGVRLGVATGKGAHGAAVSIRQFGFADVFDVVETGSEERFVKPELLRRILARWDDLDPASVAYLGDVPWDADAAREVGAQALLAAWNAGADIEGLRAKKPLALFHTVAEFRAWISGNI